MKQIVFFKNCPPMGREAIIPMSELFILEVYLFPFSVIQPYMLYVNRKLGSR